MTTKHKLPPGWVWTTLGEVADSQQKRVKPQNYPDLKFVGMDHIEAHTMRLLGTVPASEMKSNAEYFEPGDVLYGRLRPYLNKVFCADFEGLCSAEFIPFRQVPHLKSKYLQYFLNSWEFVSFATHLNEGDRPRVRFDQIADYPFPLPPLPEQHRIVDEIEAQFTRLDAGIAALKRAGARLHRYRAAVLKAACEGSLLPQDPTDEPASLLLQRILAERRQKWETEQIAKGKDPAKLTYQGPTPPDASDLPDLPEGWVWATVEQLNPFDRPCAYGVLQPGPHVENGVLMIRVGDINDGRIQTEGMKRVKPEIAEKYVRTKLMGGEVVLTLVGAIGRSAVVPQSLIGANTARAVGVIPLSQYMQAHWVEIWFRNPEKAYEMISKAHEVARKTLNLEDVRSATVAVPPLPEQHRIVEEVERRLSVVEEVEATLEANLKRAERLRQAVLKQAFAGKLVPQDPNDEPAAALLERIKAQRAKEGAENGKNKNKAAQLRLPEV